MKFFDVDRRGIAELSPLSGGKAPFGETVYAENRHEAQELFFRYQGGERYLKRTLWVEDRRYHNVIYAGKRG